MAPPRPRAGIDPFPYIRSAGHRRRAKYPGGERMASEIKLPELGENVEGGDVVDVKVAEGAEVKEGQALLEVEAEKSTVEVPSPSAGRISKVHVKKGDKVKTGQPLFLLETDGTGQ